MKQSSIEWLESKVKQMIQNGGDADLLGVLSHIKQAKSMHKEEIENAWWAGCDEGASPHIIFPSEDCNGYYNQTFKSK